MPVEVVWFEQDHVVRLNLVGDVTIEDMQEAVKTYIEMIESVEGNWLIHTLHDADHMESLPKSLKQTANVVRDAFQHPRSGWTIAYAVHKPVLKLFGNMITGMLRVRYRIMESQADALAFLQQVDQTLPELVADTANS